MRKRHGGGWGLVYTALLLAWAGETLAADKTYVLISGIPGQSTDAGHVNWIDANGLDTKVTRASGGGAVFSDIAILKGTDKATPLLHNAVISGQQFDVTIEVCRQGQSGQECYYRLELPSTLVTGVDLSGSSCVGPAACTPAQTESVTLAFGRIKWVYTPYTNGTPGTQVSRCYDLVTHTFC